MAEAIDSLLVKLGLETDAKGFRDANNAFTNMRTTALATGAGLTAAFAGMAKVADGTAKSRDSLAKWADTANVTKKRAQELTYALKQVGGSEADMMSMFDNVNQLRDQAKFGQLSDEAFEGLGLDFYAIQNMGNEAALDHIMRTISGIEDPDQRRRVASALNFSSPAQRGVMENYDRTHSDIRRGNELGGIASDQLFDNSAAYTAALTELEQVAQGFKDTIANQMLPGMTKFVEGITGWSVENKDEMAAALEKAMPYLQATAAGIGLLVTAQLGKKGAALLAANAPAAAAIGLVAFYSDKNNQERAASSIQSSLNHVVVRPVKKWLGYDDPDFVSAGSVPAPINDDVPWVEGVPRPEMRDNDVPMPYAGPPSAAALGATSSTTITNTYSIDARGSTDPAATAEAVGRVIDERIANVARMSRDDFPRNVE